MQNHQQLHNIILIVISYIDDQIFAECVHNDVDNGIDNYLLLRFGLIKP